jgi:hypothetical protein
MTISFSGVDIIFLNRRHVFVPLGYVSVEITCFSNLSILMAVEIKPFPIFLISLRSGHNMYGPQDPEMRLVTEYFSVYVCDGSITISTNYAGSGITVSEPPVYSPTLKIFFRCSPYVSYFRSSGFWRRVIW